MNYPDMGGLVAVRSNFKPADFPKCEVCGKTIYMVLFGVRVPGSYIIWSGIRCCATCEARIMGYAAQYRALLKTDWDDGKPLGAGNTLRQRMNRRRAKLGAAKSTHKERQQ